MKIRVDKLRANLALLQPVVPKKPTLPVITNVLVKYGLMAATDLENTVMPTRTGTRGRIAFTLSFSDGTSQVMYREMKS